MFYSIDIHSLTKTEAKVAIDNFIDSQSSFCQEVEVIHGYSSTILRDYVRKQYRHKRVSKKILTTNPGITILVLKNG
ncbi:MAG: Smr/MutS family protein [Erysipelotrichaceae bacterium]|nr:Smr/MutS family protein [Erysipelotrichaceae bacterium]MDD3809038.1 Smr/MutS family protein [Erysipelotrichaceae bacterium]